MKQEPKDRLGTVAEDREGGSKDDQESLKSNEFFKGVDWKGLEEVFFFGIHFCPCLAPWTLAALGFPLAHKKTIFLPHLTQKNSFQFALYNLFQELKSLLVFLMVRQTLHLTTG